MEIDANPPVETVLQLFEEYSRQIGVPIQDHPANYELVLVQMDQGVPAACAAMRHLGGGIAEMKRLYVRPKYRGAGLGRAMALHIIEHAKLKGYRAIRLDTLPQMEPAIAVYRSLGFRQIPPYHDGPLPDLLFFELELNAPHLFAAETG